MAYIHDIAVTTQASTTAATYVMNMPEHAVGDLLVWYASCDAGTLTPSGSTWTIIGTNPTSTTTNIIITAAGYRVATTTNETLSLATSDVASCVVVCFKEVAASPFNVAPTLTAVNTATSTPVGASNSSTVDNTLHVSMIAQSGANPMAVSGPGAMWAAMSDAGGTTDTLSAHNAVAWSFKRTAGAIPPINWVSNLSSQYTRLTFTLAPSVGARIPPYIDGVALTPATLVHLGSYSTSLNGVTHTTNGITATINGKTATPTTATTLPDTGVDPYTSILTSAAAQTAVGVLVGPEVTITTALNFTNKLMIGTVNTGNWKQGTFGVGSVRQGGVVMRIGSGAAGTTTWNAYQVAAKDSQVPPAVPVVFVIEPGYATTAYATGAGGSANGTAVKFVQVLRNAPSFSSQAGFSELWMVDKQVVAGGDATYPIGLNELVDVGKSYRLPLVQKAGASSVVFFAPIQIGGGDAVYFNVTGGVIQFPGRASATEKDLQYHASDNRLGLYISAKSGDTFNLVDSLVKSPISQVFEITTTATSAATWNLTGTTLDGMNVILRPVTTFTSMTFSKSTGFTTNASAFSECIFSNGVEVTAAGSSFSGCTFAKTTSTVGALSITSSTIAGLQTELDKLTNCSFHDNTTGAGLVIKYTGSEAGPFELNLSTGSFTGNTFDIKWSPTTAKTLTLNVTGAADAATITSTLGSASISNPNLVILTGLVPGTEIRAYVGTDPVTSTQIASIDDGVLLTSTWSFTQSFNGQQGYIQIFNVNYQPIWLDITYSSSDVSIPVQQVLDRNYQP